jgi:transposase
MVTLTRKATAERNTYRQVWPAYNAAQTTEKHRLQVLLHELCRGIEEPPQEKGRPRASLRDMVFSAVFKVYSTVSGRRFQCDLNDACGRGYIRQAPHYNTVFKYLETEAMTPILKRLIIEASLPLKSVEVDFAVDSSGFSTSRFVRWFDHKYGVVQKKYDWVKVSVITGVKTNIITAVHVDEKKGGDCPQFVPLVKETARSFTIRKVSADAAYVSYENADLVAQHGGAAYILFKANTTCAEGGTLAKMFHLYNLNREDYLNHYHKRSNSESTFSMVKAKFGDSLRSKTDTAMVNEALAKILCHDICCLIHALFELGIESKFWKEEEERRRWRACRRQVTWMRRGSGCEQCHLPGAYHHRYHGTY